MYCVIYLENLNRLITKKDDGIVKYVNIIAPIRLNFVENKQQQKQHFFFFLEQILLTSFCDCVVVSTVQSVERSLTIMKLQLQCFLIGACIPHRWASYPFKI